MIPSDFDDTTHHCNILISYHISRSSRALFEFQSASHTATRNCKDASLPINCSTRFLLTTYYATKSYKTALLPLNHLQWLRVPHAECLQGTLRLFTRTSSETPIAQLCRAFCCNPRVVETTGHPFPGPFKFCSVTIAASTRAAWSCFELPTGKVTLTLGLHAHNGRISTVLSALSIHKHSENARLTCSQPSQRRRSPSAP